MVKIRDGQVGNRPIYAAIGVDLDGHKDILGLWAGVGGGESAKFWLQVLSELRNRGVEDIFFVVCDGLKGLPDSVGSAYPAAIVQTCIIHLVRNTFRYASKKYWGQIAADLKPIYRAPSREAAWRAFEEFEEKWGKPYPAISRLWRNAWEQFVPFLDYDPEIRTVLCSTNAIESLHSRYRRAVSVRGHFPTEQAAMKCLYLVTRSLDPKGTGQTRWAVRWKPALNAFAITFADRMPAKATDHEPPLTPLIGQSLHGQAPPHQMAPVTEARVVELRRAHSVWGADRIRYQLVRHGLVVAEPRRRRRADYRRWERGRADGAVADGCGRRLPP